MWVSRGWNWALLCGAIQWSKEQWADTDAQNGQPEHEEELYYASDHVLEQIGQRDCGGSLTGDTPEPSEHSPGPCALG